MITSDDPNTEAAMVLHAFVATKERELISARTREGLARRRAEGVRLGRPSGLDAAVVARIMEERAEGRSFRQIAAGLNADDIATAQGAAGWSAASVRYVTTRNA